MMIGPEHTAALAKLDFNKEPQEKLTRQEAYKLFKQNIRAGMFCILFTLVVFHLIENLSLIWMFTGYLGLFFIGHSAITQIRYNLIPNRTGFFFLAFVGIVLILPSVGNFFYLFYIFLGIVPIFTLVGIFILIGPPTNQRKRLKSI